MKKTYYLVKKNKYKHAPKYICFAICCVFVIIFVVLFGSHVIQKKTNNNKSNLRNSSDTFIFNVSEETLITSDYVLSTSGENEKSTEEIRISTGYTSIIQSTDESRKTTGESGKTTEDSGESTEDSGKSTEEIRRSTGESRTSTDEIIQSTEETREIRRSTEIIGKTTEESSSTGFSETEAFQDGHSDEVSEFFSKRQKKRLSKLGEILFMNAALPEKAKRNFTILMWNEGPFLERRHMKFFTNQMHDPFSNCSVDNCVITYNSSALEYADGVVFLLQKLGGVGTLPQEVVRPAGQRWIFLTDESPLTTFTYSRKNHWHNYSDVFNWSMSYKMESDIPVPNARTIPLSEKITLFDVNEDSQEIVESLIPYGEVKQRNVLVATVMTNCDKESPRTAYLKELEKHIKIDVFGSCGDNLKTITPSCTTKATIDCADLNGYIFYLSFEVYTCDQYMTEKLFWNAFTKGAIPVISGPSKDNCDTILPPNSYLHIDDYNNPEDLAKKLLEINATWDEGYFAFHRWRQDFAILNEHGYYGTRSFHYCRLCEGLNYNSKDEKVYNDLSEFLNPDVNCK